MQDKMSGRLRMQLAMKRKCPDCVPVMPQLCHPHAVNILFDDYRKGMAEMVEHPERIPDLMIELATLYGVDGLRLFVPPNPYKVADDGDLMVVLDSVSGDKKGRVDLFGGGAIIFDEKPDLVETLDDLRNLKVFRCEELLSTEPFQILKQGVNKSHKRGLFAASQPFGFTMNYLSDRRGREQALMDLVMNPDLVERIMDRAVEIAIERSKALVKCGIDALYIGDPGASASLISPSHFERFCLPAYQKFCRELHKYDILIYIHICGNSRPILEFMADTGADCIEPLDPLGGVDVADAKARVGSRVCLMGGVNTLTLLNGTPEDVYNEALQCCRAGGYNGGYILASGDMIPDMSSKENVMAMVKCAHEFVYPEQYSSIAPSLG